MAMPPYVRLDGLLFSTDPELLGVMNQVLPTFAIETEVCRDLSSAVDTVTHRRLDALIVDWEESPNPSRIVRAARKSSPNSDSTIVAVVNNDSETHALMVGANFIIHKPANAEHASRCMRAAYGTILQNRRRTARVSIDLPVEARLAEIGTIEARISDLSIGGLALQCRQPVELNREVLAHFSLPGSQQVLFICGKVVNANQTGRAGIRFSFVPEEDLDVLEKWLAVELAKLEKAEIPTAYAETCSE